MPWTCLFCIIGAASISAFPLTNGFVSKSIIMSASLEHFYLVWFVLLFAAAGVFHHAGIKIPFFAFFSHDRGLRTKSSQKYAVCDGYRGIFVYFLGLLSTAIIRPSSIDNTLPSKGVPYTPYDYSHVVSQTQLLFFSALAFCMLMLWTISS